MNEMKISSAKAFTKYFMTDHVTINYIMHLFVRNPYKTDTPNFP